MDKIVNYNKYCKICKYRDLPKNNIGGEQEPCETCLSEPVNTDTNRPIKFEENKKEKGNKKCSKN